MAVYAVLAAGVVAAFQVGKVVAALPSMRAELDLGLVTAGWMISLLGVAGAFGGLLAGNLADRVGYRRALLGGLALLASGSFLGSLAQTSAGILASRALEGLGFIATVVVGPAMMMRAASPHHSRIVVGIWGTYMSVGMCAIMLLAPPLLAAGGWRQLWLFNAFALATVFLFAAWATRGMVAHISDTAASPFPALRGAALVLSRPGPWVLALCFLTYAINFFAVLGFLPTFLVDDVGYSPRSAVPLVALVILTNAPGALLGSWLLQRGVRRWVLVALGSAAMALCSVGIFANDIDALLRYLLALAFPFFGAFVPISVLAAAPVHAPDPRLVASTNGLFMQGSNIGQLIGPPALALVVAAAGSWQAAPVFTCAVSGAGVLLALVVRRLEPAVNRTP